MRHFFFNMIGNRLLRVLFILMTASLIYVSADAQQPPPNPVETDTLAPFVTSTTIAGVTSSTATLGGNVTGDGGAAVTERGVVYSQSNTVPTVGDIKVLIGSGTGVYAQNIGGLNGGTTYYVRAYATNIIGTSYGAVVSFTTNPSVPIISTNEISAIGNTNATVGGNVSSSGGAAVTERGVVYSTINVSPTVSDTKVQIGSGIGNFSQAITGLTQGTLYYLRAYAVNSAGTNYGSVFSFTPAGASVTTSAVSGVLTNTAVLGGNVTSIGSSAVTERGIVYVAGNSVPTLTDTKVVMGSGAGVFSQSIGALQPATTYSVRAYATNTAATNYGSLQSFTTQTSLNSITRVGAARTNGIVVNYTVVFAQAVTGLTTSNFSVTTTGLTNAYVTAVTGSGTTWNVTAYTGTGSGTIVLNLANSTGINPGVSNTLPFAGDVITIDRILPVLTPVSISSNNTNIGFAKTGDIVTIGFTASEIISTPTVTIAGRSAAVTNTSGNVWTAAITMTNADTEGALAFTIVYSDIAGNPGATISASTDNTSVTFDKTAPSISSILVSSSNASTVTFAVTFSENVTGVDAADFALTLSALPGSSINSIAGSGSAYLVVVNLGTGSGSVRLDLKNAGTGISDAASNAIAAGYTTGQVFFLKPILKVTAPAAICAPGTIDLTAAAVTSGSDAGQSFSYFTDAAATQTLNNPSSISVSGTYYIRGNIGSALSDVIPIIVTVSPLPSENILSPNGTVICGNSPVLLTVTSGNNYVWSKDGLIIPTATGNQLSITGSGGVYGVTITTTAGCSAPAKNKIIVSSLLAPVASFTFNTFCTSIPVNFANNSVVASSGPVTYAWSDNNGNTSSAASAIFNYSQVGTYQVKLKVSSVTCPALVDSITKPIAVERPTAAQRLSTVSINNNDPVQLQARTFGANYSWSPVTGLSNSSIVNPTVRLENETDYTIRTIAASGCVTVDSLLVKVFTERVYVPAAFTPNGDGLNDKLFVNLIGMKQLQHFSVYNRYGKKMFETSSISEGWDGTFNGTKQPMDTYVWTVEGVDKYGFYVATRGSVTLIR